MFHQNRYKASLLNDNKRLQSVIQKNEPDITTFACYFRVLGLIMGRKKLIDNEF
jgi:hypothetical protein